MKKKSKAPKKNCLDAHNSARLREVPNIEERVGKVAKIHIAVADDYPDWLLSQRGTITPEADLDF